MNWVDDQTGLDRDPADPFATLGIAPDASDAELRRAYHRLAKLHHPDHNGGSPLAARRFAEIQAAHSLIVRLRRGGGRAVPATGERGAPGVASEVAPRRAWAEPWLDDRIAAFERDYEEARSPAGADPARTPPSGARLNNTLRRRLTDLFGDP